MYGNSEIPLKQYIFDEDESFFCAPVVSNPRVKQMYLKLYIRCNLLILSPSWS